MENKLEKHRLLGIAESVLMHRKDDLIIFAVKPDEAPLQYSPRFTWKKILMRLRVTCDDKFVSVGVERLNDETGLDFIMAGSDLEGKVIPYEKRGGEVVFPYKPDMLLHMSFGPPYKMLSKAMSLTFQSSETPEPERAALLQKDAGASMCELKTTPLSDGLEVELELPGKLVLSQELMPGLRLRFEVGRRLWVLSEDCFELSYGDWSASSKGESWVPFEFTSGTLLIKKIY